MPIIIDMPRLSDTMEEGTINTWRVKVGDKVSASDVLADIETDKATMEVQTFDEGTVAKLCAEEGETLAVGDTIVVLAEEGESVEDAAAAAGDKAKKPKADKADEDKDEADASQREPEDDSDESDADQGDEDKASGGRVRVSPVARKMAEEADLDLGSIKGSGPGGRIIKRDVQAALEGAPKGKGTKASSGKDKPATSASAPMAAAKLESRKIPLSSMRKTIAKRLVESKTTIPHFQVTMAIDMQPLMTLRAQINEQLESQGVKLSVNDFVVRDVTMALMRHPMVNSSWNGNDIQQHGTIGIGIAVALPEEKGGGLVVPVLHDVQNMSLRAISEQTRKLAKKARESGLSMDEMSGSTFTISNLGMYGVDEFNAIINPPNSAILAVGAALEKPVVRKGQIVVGLEMKVTLSADHRVVDGASAAEFLQTFKSLIEAPTAMLV